MFQVNAKKIRALLFSQKMNISELAKKANLQNASVSRLITDGATANARRLAKLPTRLGLTAKIFC